MRDPRIAKVAEILVDYSAEVKEDEVVEIYAFEGAKPLFLPAKSVGEVTLLLWLANTPCRRKSPRLACPVKELSSRRPSLAGSFCSEQRVTGA